MDCIEITGGLPLSGRIAVAGAKNACLALMPAAMLSQEPVILHNAPRLTDIATMSNLLRTLGVEVDMPGGSTISLHARGNLGWLAEYDIVRKMRASILVLGPLLAREGRATVSLPGGCAIGARPIDLHLDVLRKMGADLELRQGYVHAAAPRGLHGTIMEFPTVSVGATENAMMAATLANGVTELRNAAREPEIADLAACLTGMGARIEGAGTNTVRIEGVSSLVGTTHSVIPDRIEIGTYMLAAAITGGEITLDGARRDLITTFADTLETAGVIIEEEDGLLRTRLDGRRLRAIDVATAPYPGFPTDLQAQLMAALTVADGTSILEERIFENRFMHASELGRMGADIRISGRSATVTGVSGLKGAPVMATDLRASVSLVLAGLAAAGKTTINRVYHLDRGYEQVEQKLSACGARIRRISQ